MTDAVADQVTPTLEKGLTRGLRQEGRGAGDEAHPPRGQGLRDDNGEGPPIGHSLEAELAEKEELLHAVEAMREQNPMLGMRGVRLGLMIPDIVQMQTRAILAGAARVAAEGRRRCPRS